MNKSEAVRKINECAHWMRQYRFWCSSDMENELIELLDVFSDEVWLDFSVLSEFNNGFYLGEMENGERNGFGAYLWYNSSEPNRLYLGDWKNGVRQGHGMYMSDGFCYFGGFVNSEYQGNGSYAIGRGGVEIFADFYKGDITYLKYSTKAFTFNGKSYGVTGFDKYTNGNNSSGNSSNGSSYSNSSDDGYGCIGYIILGAIIWGLIKCCS